MRNRILADLSSWFLSGGLTEYFTPYLCTSVPGNDFEIIMFQATLLFGLWKIAPHWLLQSRREWLQEVDVRNWQWVHRRYLHRPTSKDHILHPRKSNNGDELEPNSIGQTKVFHFFLHTKFFLIFVQLTESLLYTTIMIIQIGLLQVLDFLESPGI